MRNLERTTPYPFPVTVAFLRDAIGKLRAVGAKEDWADRSGGSKLDLWRGLRDTAVTDAFLERGGSELSTMSSTSNLDVAMQYASAECAADCDVHGEGHVHACMMLKLRTESFMQRGASIKSFSCFPSEDEFLYPPLTYLQPTGKQTSIAYKNRIVNVIEVVPQFGS